MEDTEIVDLFLKRDEKAINEVAQKYGSRLRALAFGILADRESAEECENDAYMEAWRLIPPNEPREYLFPFLSKIARHLAIDRCRKQNSSKRKADIVELSEEMETCIPAVGDVESNFEGKALQEKINDYLKKISVEKRVVFVRRYYYLDSVTDISKRCKVSESKVKSILFRTRNELKEYLIKEGYDI